MSYFPSLLNHPILPASTCCLQTEFSFSTKHFIISSLRDALVRAIFPTRYDRRDDSTVQPRRVAD
jgi:hypothetical protein